MLIREVLNNEAFYKWSSINSTVWRRMLYKRNYVLYVPIKASLTSMFDLLWFADGKILVEDIVKLGTASEAVEGSLNADTKKPPQNL